MVLICQACLSKRTPQARLSAGLTLSLLELLFELNFESYSNIASRSPPIGNAFSLDPPKPAGDF